MSLQMFLFIFDSPTQIIFVVVIIGLLFGAGRLPQLARSLGQSKKAFRQGMREAEQEESLDNAKLDTSPVAPNISEMTDEQLLAEMRRRVETERS